MNLNDAIALKEQLVADLMDPNNNDWYIEKYRPRHRYGALPKKSGIALGVTDLATGGYGIAIRVQDSEMDRFAEKLKSRVGGQADKQELLGNVHGVPPIRPKRTARTTLPLVIGLPISHARCSDGRLGAFVKVRGDDDGIYALSNNHVIAALNRGRQGDVITQPGRRSGGRVNRNRIGALETFELLKWWAGVNEMDAALCKLDPNLSVSQKLGPLGIKDPTVGDIVEKRGASDGQRGIITAVQMSLLTIRCADSPHGFLRFDGAFEVQGLDGQAFSLPGHSGSLICVCETGQAVGLLFASRSRVRSDRGVGVTYASPIAKVLDALNADLLLSNKQVG
ncbi:hypothetical protein [Streptomyces ehimensis]|uniref:Uncharacterized protein n=1 Tax=Streptomyces ehimensis TaxID=68195 RepID=A0ABV9BBC8_9ACTN